MRLGEERRRICFHCANIYKSKETDWLCCPECGYRVSSRRYHLIVDRAREAVDYGYQYRLKYEEDFAAEGAITKHYALTPFNEFLTFVAVAAASGIVGNLSTDLVKRAVGKVREALRREEKGETGGKLTALLDDPEKMKQFMDYIDAYFTCFEEIEPHVRAAIYEEMIVDRISPTMTDRLMKAYPQLKVEQAQEISPFTQEEIFRMMIEARRDLSQRPGLKPSLFEGFWEGVEPESEQNRDTE